jgi:2-polyprenyl-3-methyl-5-hydroxy-6-metoxy-1,4-benzoquinol methylase
MVLTMPPHPADDKMTANLRSWDERVAIHTRDTTGIYGIDKFLAGGDTLMPIEHAEIGDVAGKRIAHLQCHFGLDTLSLARRGAIVFGLDFSPKAIDAAHDYATQTKLDATFVCGNVYNADTLLPTATFDMVYVTWGTICSLPDMVGWAENVARLLRPGGTLYLADCHPTMNQLEFANGGYVFSYPWRSTGGDDALSLDEPASYAGDGTLLTNTRTFEWPHSFSEILGALLGAGMQLDFLHEHDTLPWKAVPVMISAGERIYHLPDDLPGPPVAFSLQARKC